VDDPLVERTRQIFEHFSRRDAAAMLELCDPEVEFLPVTASMVAGG
jgi:ketosteroid isomerase-like protein